MAVVFHRGLLHAAIEPKLVAECKYGSDLLNKALGATRVTKSGVLRPNKATRRKIRDGSLQAMYEFENTELNGPIMNSKLQHQLGVFCLVATL